MTALPSHVQELADRVATGHGVEVLELALRGQGRGRVLRVVLDAEEPVEADVVELVSKDLSRALDQADPVQGVVVDADDEAVLLEVGGSQVRVPLSEVVRGKVVLPW